MSKKSADQTVSDVDSALAAIHTVSGKIRYLATNGWKRSHIAKKLDIRYQHVRNVLVAPPPKKRELL